MSKEKEFPTSCTECQYQEDGKPWYVGIALLHLYDCPNMPKRKDGIQTRPCLEDPESPFVNPPKQKHKKVSPSKYGLGGGSGSGRHSKPGRMQE